ncbi:hypothetical protein [Nonomuraea typhae]|uniref:hypothetical protein n=1 Tax=Nonomuraea typhae TaxID=2603600 RepID=UPI0012FB0204|nr:hypothetical protein [Nonomuraea typhae]
MPGQESVELAAQVASDRAAAVVVYYLGPYCNRSKIAAAAFARLGYAGGKQGWAEAGLAFDGSRASAGAGRPA